MEVSTSPNRWRRVGLAEKEERAKRTNVTRLIYYNDSSIKSRRCMSSEELLESLTESPAEETAQGATLKVFVAEDLSRDVIEHLGSQLDIEPEFFREQMLGNEWYNIRDRHTNPRRLRATLRKRQWITIRYVTARYYSSAESFEVARRQAACWNVERRLDDDNNSSNGLDGKGTIVSLNRARASFWLQDGVNGTPAIGKYNRPNGTLSN